MNPTLETFTADRMALVLVSLSAAVISAGLIALIRPLLRRYALARPNARSSHVVPTPQGAGIAVIAATFAAAFAAAGLMNLVIPATLFGATVFIALVGFADDVRPIPVLPRLLLQGAAIGVVLLAAPSDLRIMPACPLGIERGLLWLAGLWFVNLVNFMDGLDLMTAAEVVPITFTMMLMSWLGLLPAVPGFISAALCGAMLGFAPFNRPVARVFLGDVGSLPIGLLLGWCLLQLAWHQHLIAALLLPLYYLADATLTLLRRIGKREPFWAAHRSHFYQRATDNGFTTPQVVVHVFLLNIVLAALAFASIRMNSAGEGFVFLLTGALLVGFVLLRFSLKKPS